MRVLSLFILTIFFSSLCLAQTPKTLMAQNNNSFEYIGKLGKQVVTISNKSGGGVTPVLKCYFGTEQDLFKESVEFTVNNAETCTGISAYELNDSTLFLKLRTTYQCDIGSSEFVVLHSDKTFDRLSLNGLDSRFVCVLPNQNLLFNINKINAFEYFEYDIISKKLIKSNIDDKNYFSIILNDNVFLKLGNSKLSCYDDKANIVTTPSYITDEIKDFTNFWTVERINLDIFYFKETVDYSKGLYRYYFFSNKSNQFLGSIPMNSFYNFRIQGDDLINQGSGDHYKFLPNAKISLIFKNKYLTDLNFYPSSIYKFKDQYCAVGKYYNNCMSSINDAHVFMTSNTILKTSSAQLNVEIKSSKPPVFENKNYRFSQLIYSFTNTSDTIINSFAMKDNFSSSYILWCQLSNFQIKKYKNLYLKKGETFNDTLTNILVRPISFDAKQNQIKINITAINDYIDNKLINSCGAFLYSKSQLEVGTQDAENQQFTNVFINDNNIKISCEKAEYFPIKLQLFDLNGRLLKTATFENNEDTIELPQGLSSGMYIANLKCSDGVQFAKKLIFTRY